MATDPDGLIVAILESAERGTPLIILLAGELDMRGQRLLRVLRDEGVPYMSLRRAEAGQAAARPGSQSRDMVEMHLAPKPEARPTDVVTVPASEMALNGARVLGVRVELLCGRRWSRRWPMAGSPR